MALAGALSIAAAVRRALVILALVSSDRRRFEYSMVRFVPYTPSGEFVNIGALAGSDAAQEWACARVADTLRAEQFGGRATLDTALKLIDSFKESVASRSVDGTPDPWGAWLRHLHRDHQGLVQVTYPIPMSAPSAAAAVETLLEVCVGKQPT